MVRVSVATMRSSILEFLTRTGLKEKIFFVHIPKCGGVSVSNAIEGKYGLAARLGRTTFNVDPSASTTAARTCGVELQEFRRYLISYASERSGLRYLSGHVQFGVDALPADEWSVVTVLRDPVEKWFSQYFYNRYKKSRHPRIEDELERFIETPAAREYGSDYLRYLGSFECRSTPSIDDAVRNLNRFRVVGVLEELDRFVQSFRAEFGITLRIPRRNANPVSKQKREERIDAELRRRVADLCRPNLAVYEEVCQRLSSRN